MRLVHFADTHLAFKRHQRTTPSGQDQRERDVEQSFERVIDMTIALTPDLVVIAGDVFHVVQPRNASILHAFDQFRRLTQALPNTIVVAVAGNHDQPKSRDAVPIMRILTRIGIHVVDVTPRRLSFPERGLSVMCVPEVHELAETLAPDPAARYNVLVVHGEVAGIIKGSRPRFSYDKTDLATAGWDYVALGHYHDFTEVAPRVFYSGAIDFTTTDVWREAPVKGIIEFDLDTHTHTFHPIAGIRPHIDLPVIDAGEIDTPAVIAQLRANVAAIGGVDGKVVRQVVKNFNRDRAKDIPRRSLSDLYAKALFFQLDWRQPERVEVVNVGMTRANLGTLRDRLGQYMREERKLDPDIDKEALIALGFQYFDATADLLLPTQEKIESAQLTPA